VVGTRVGGVAHAVGIEERLARTATALFTYVENGAEINGSLTKISGPSVLSSPVLTSWSAEESEEFGEYVHSV
jgi:hypothetical protein